jgi:hypothetical protein
LELATNPRFFMRVFLGTISIALLAACTPSTGDPACGITSLAGATVLLDQFNVPRQTLADAPIEAPGLLPVRVAAGPALRGSVTLGEMGWVVRVEGEPPPGETPGFGVLVIGMDASARGIMLYSGPPVVGAPHIGVVSVGALQVPLIGIRADVAGLETPSCPFFPDSLRGP